MRLIAVRLPPEKHAPALARLEREYGKGKVSAESRRPVLYVVLVTTVPAGRLTAAQLIALDRARWQVELAIRRDKSICDLDALPNFREATIDTWLQAKLLEIERARRLSTTDVPFPPKPSLTTRSRRASRPSRLPFAVRETWRRLVVAWHACRGAILHVPLRDIPRVMMRVLEHLARTSDRHRVRRLDVFLDRILPQCG